MCPCSTISVSERANLKLDACLSYLYLLISILQVHGKQPRYSQMKPLTHAPFHVPFSTHSFHPCACFTRSIVFSLFLFTCGHTCSSSNSSRSGPRRPHTSPASAPPTSRPARRRSRPGRTPVGGSRGAVQRDAMWRDDVLEY